MLELSKKQYKKLLAEFLGNPFHEPLKVHIDFENELLYFLDRNSNFVWYLEGNLTTLIKEKGWEILPKSLLKRANKVILQDKHFIVIEPKEVVSSGTANHPVVSLYDGVSSGQSSNHSAELQTTLEADGWCIPTMFKEKPQNEEHPKRAVCALITRSDYKGLSFLSVSRKDNPTDFGLPGGKVEPQEDLYAALYREVLEETGYTIEDEALEVFCKVDQVGYEVTTLIVKINHAIPRKELSSDETGVVSWVSAGDLIKGSFGEYNKQLFESLGYNHVSS